MPERRPPPNPVRPKSARRGRDAVRWPAALLGRLGAFALLWLVVTGNEPGAWPFGLVAAAAATAASWALMPPGPLRWHGRGVLRFVPVFLWDSLRGGLDVAWRAFHPRLPIAPTLVAHRLRLPDGLPKVILTGMISLLPGTLSAGSEGGRVRIHWLDRNPRWSELIDADERRVAGLFGLDLPVEADERRRGRGRHG